MRSARTANIPLALLENPKNRSGQKLLVSRAKGFGNKAKLYVCRINNRICMRARASV